MADDSGRGSRMGSAAAVALLGHGRVLAALLGVRVESSAARAVFDDTVLLAEYLEADGETPPRVVLMAEGITEWARRCGEPAGAIENRAVLHELLHHVARSAPQE